MKKKIVFGMNAIFVAVFCLWLFCVWRTGDVQYFLGLFFALVLNESLYIFVWRNKDMSVIGATELCLYYAAIILLGVGDFFPLPDSEDNSEYYGGRDSFRHFAASYKTPSQLA